MKRSRSHWLLHAGKKRSFNRQTMICMRMEQAIKSGRFTCEHLDPENDSLALAELREYCRMRLAKIFGEGSPQ